MKTLNDFYRLFPNRPALVGQPLAPTPVPALEAVPSLSPVRLSARYRQRDFGTGYGRSSGYAKDHSYTGQRCDRLLRVY